MHRSLSLGAFLHNLYHSDGKRSFTYVPADVFLKELKKYGVVLRSVCATVKYYDSLPSDTPPMILEEEGIDLYHLPTWLDTAQLLKILTKNWERIRRTIKRFISSCDVVWIRIPTPLLGLLLKEAHRQDKPVVIHAAGSIRDAWLGSKHRGLKRIPVLIGAELMHRYMRYLIRSQIVLATGPSVADLLSGPGRRVIPFVDNLTDVLKSRSAKKKLASRFIYVGRIVPRKGLPLVFSALRRLKDKGVTASFKIVGTGPMIEELKHKAVTLGVSDYVTWRGFVPAGPALDAEYRKAGVFILASEISEGFPRVILEAWSRGLAVVTSNTEGLNRIIHHEQNGLLFPVGNDKALAETLIKLKDNYQLYRKLIRGGYTSLMPYTFSKQLKVAAEAFQQACSE